jgi:hypothetical protein
MLRRLSNCVVDLVQAFRMAALAVRAMKKGGWLVCFDYNYS